MSLFIFKLQVELSTDCQRTSSVTRTWMVWLINDDATVLLIDIAGDGGTVGDAGVTFGKASLTYGLYAYTLTALMTGHHEFNDTTAIYARVQGKHQM